MSNNLWVLVESWAGVPVEASLSVVAQARRVADAAGGTVTAVVIGDEVDQAVARAGAAGAQTVRRVSGGYADYSTEAWTAALHTLVTEHRPDCLLAAATTVGADVSPRLAARLGSGMLADCSAIEVGADGIIAVKSELGGSTIARCRVTTGMPVITVRTGVLPPAVDGTSTAEVITESIPAAASRTTLVERVRADNDGEIALEDARIVVSGGRAMGGPDGFGVLRELAAAFGPTAAVGASRPAADSGWVPVQLEIGISGKKVSPDLYLACGISGASQHLAGMSGSKVVVAVNKDAEAPIFQVADFGVVGDLFELVPALATAVRERG